MVNTGVFPHHCEVKKLTVKPLEVGDCLHVVSTNCVPGTALVELALSHTAPSVGSPFSALQPWGSSPCPSPRQAFSPHPGATAQSNPHAAAARASF